MPCPAAAAAAAAAARLKRAGLDYWPHVCVKLHDIWEVRGAATLLTVEQQRHWQVPKYWPHVCVKLNDTWEVRGAAAAL
jgi:tRNA(Leu) C34 or U34 (ribose-2'-O)-methylase TrmL